MGVKEDEVPVTEKDLLLEIRDLLAAQNKVTTPSQTLATTELSEPEGTVAPDSPTPGKHSK